MPNREITENFYYSFNMGYIHFVLFTTEFYDPAYYDKKRLSRQYEWLISDLEVWACYECTKNNNDWRF